MSRLVQTNNPSFFTVRNSQSLYPHFTFCLSVCAWWMLPRKIHYFCSCLDPSFTKLWIKINLFFLLIFDISPSESVSASYLCLFRVALQLLESSLGQSKSCFFWVSFQKYYPLPPFGPTIKIVDLILRLVLNLLILLRLMGGAWVILNTVLDLVRMICSCFSLF